MANAARILVGRSVGHTWAVSVATSGHFCWPPTGRNYWPLTHTLQRKTVLALQDAVQAMARFAGQAMHFDHMQARQGKYTQLPDAPSDDTFANLVEVRRLTSRILNSDVRNAVDVFIALSTRLSMLPTDLEGLAGSRLADDASAKLAELNDGYDAMSRILGEAARREIAWQPADLAE